MTKTWYSAWLLIKVVVPTSKFDLGVLAAVVLYLNPLPLWLMLKTPDRAKDCCCRKYYKHANLVTSVKASVKFTMNSNEFCVGIRRAFENFCSHSYYTPYSSYGSLLAFCFLILDFGYFLVYRYCMQWRCGWNFDSTDYPQWISYDAKRITSQRCKIMSITAYCQTSDI